MNSSIQQLSLAARRESLGNQSRTALADVRSGAAGLNTARPVNEPSSGKIQGIDRELHQRPLEQRLGPRSQPQSAVWMLQISPATPPPGRTCRRCARYRFRAIASAPPCGVPWRARAISSRAGSGWARLNDGATNQRRLGRRMMKLFRTHLDELRAELGKSNCTVGLTPGPERVQ